MFTILVVGALLVLLLVVLSPPTRRAPREFRCPFAQRDVTAEFDEDVWSGRRLDVTSCSAFSPAKSIACDANCLRLRSLRP